MKTVKLMLSIIVIGVWYEDFQKTISVLTRYKNPVKFRQIWIRQYAQNSQISLNSITHLLKCTQSPDNCDRTGCRRGNIICRLNNKRWLFIAIKTFNFLQIYKRENNFYKLLQVPRNVELFFGIFFFNAYFIVLNQTDENV